jgi:hypothetical protein
MKVAAPLTTRQLRELPDSELRKLANDKMFRKCHDVMTGRWPLLADEALLVMSERGNNGALYRREASGRCWSRPL